MPGNCPVCETPAINDLLGELVHVDCPRCGSYKITGSAKATADWVDGKADEQIRRSRFLVADLSEDNSGAYWEAGFAEGLGRPVIYTCEKGQATHFDTRQQQTIFWVEDKLDEAARRFKDTIRATLPSEAVLNDAE